MLSDPPQTIISLPVQTAVVQTSALGRVACAGGCPTICAGIISPTGVEIIGDAGALQSPPDDHLAARPDCRVPTSRIGRTRCARGGPSVCAGTIPPAGVEITGAAVDSTPNNHFAACPDRCMPVSTVRRPGSSSPTVVVTVIIPRELLSQEAYTLRLLLPLSQAFAFPLWRATNRKAVICIQTTVARFNRCLPYSPRGGKRFHLPVTGWLSDRDGLIGIQRRVSPQRRWSRVPAERPVLALAGLTRRPTPQRRG